MLWKIWKLGDIWGSFLIPLLWQVSLMFSIHLLPITWSWEQRWETPGESLRVYQLMSLIKVSQLFLKVLFNLVCTYHQFSTDCACHILGALNDTVCLGSFLVVCLDFKPIVHVILKSYSLSLRRGFFNWSFFWFSLLSILLILLFHVTFDFPPFVWGHWFTLKFANGGQLFFFTQLVKGFAACFLRQWIGVCAWKEPLGRLSKWIRFHFSN